MIIRLARTLSPPDEERIYQVDPTPLNPFCFSLNSVKLNLMIAQRDI